MHKRDLSQLLCPLLCVWSLFFHSIVKTANQISQTLVRVKDFISHLSKARSVPVTLCREFPSELFHRQLVPDGGR